MQSIFSTLLAPFLLLFLLHLQTGADAFLPNTKQGWEEYLAPITYPTTPWKVLPNNTDMSKSPQQRLIHITFTTFDEYYYQVRRMAQLTALSKGMFSETRAYGPSDYDHGFKEYCADVLGRKRGGGYWAWKPYILLRELHRCRHEPPNTAAVWYSDGDRQWLNNPWEYKVWANPVWLMGGWHPARAFTKRDAVVIMGVDEADMDRPKQLDGSVVGLACNNAESLLFVQLWLKFSCDARVVTDDPNVMGQPSYPEFRDHRHDQSVLDLLSRKMKIPHGSKELYKLMIDFQ